jgi:hypothetical protein
LTTIKRGRSLFILDEPTTGLHFADVAQLLDCFDALLDIGHSLVVVEHNLQVIRAADYVIDVGPGAADEGGEVVAMGTPEEIAGSAGSATGRCLAEERGAGFGTREVMIDERGVMNGLLDELLVFHGEASAALGRVYARLAVTEEVAGCELAGRVVGPRCRWAKTLPAVSKMIAVKSGGDEGGLLAEAIVPDPCFWSDEVPMLYDVHVPEKAQTVRVLNNWHSQQAIGCNLWVMCREKNCMS